MERREFVTSLGISLALACAGCLAACSGGGYGGGGSATPGGGTARLSVDLNSGLLAIGDFMISNGIIVIRVAAGNNSNSFVALSSTCTHQNCSVSTYNKATGLIECNAPCGHGSRFTTSGAVNTGPATVSLPTFTVYVYGNTLTVS
ncbi:MAG: Rieske 2Fe-2S domain-containing protein [Chitinophaga sp.]|uniref:QcrA and Rieske domain-containing protein n=1 Tax=Chitinophaga sp. TaxID=1869181 RepID=UPI0025C469D7|nr:Rieske 2Fe-2S domain-containing protein [Chitinophaga sp.]MBV8253742.1 Rieske 2Fe-2S domain-containing protein [Chitinophaga sp.]